MVIIKSSLFLNKWYSTSRTQKIKKQKTKGTERDSIVPESIRNSNIWTKVIFKMGHTLEIQLTGRNNPVTP